MLPCPACRCHVLPEHARCPHCGAARGLVPSLSVGALALLVCALVGASACATDSAAEGEEGQTVTTQVGTTEESQTETDEPPTSATVTSTGESGSETETGTMTFVPQTDLVALYGSCDPFFQDCPEGEKCVPYASTGTGTYDATKCVTVTDLEPLGEACVSSGVVEASDDCGPGLFCYYFPDEQGGVGECVAFCEGTADDPICPPGQACMIAYEGSFAACLVTCDPLIQDCADERACHWTEASFHCLLHEGLLAGEVCEGFGQCAPGLECMAAELLPECAGEACCTHYCDLSQPECPAPGTACVAFFEEGTSPGVDYTGVCLNPDAP